ncbi:MULTISPECIES: hypothetical protein [Leptolyngbya]|uniref:hypothetical protein n=1 Tax=Leptolyngbya TaxID=47251 RepID=UPI0016832785|nr:hypothetical protein [Leptolyngbya sp. FACHB-1624]MBD1854522.1 hypothetical protein [Leptolyngbya sp. FACHB-1624]
MSPILEKATLKEIEEDPTAFIPFMIAMNAISPELFGENSLSTETIERLRSRFDGEIDLNVKDEEHGKSVKVQIHGAGEKAFYSGMDRFRKRTYQKTLLYQNALISLVSAVEWFLSQLLHEYFNLHPDAAGIRNRSLTLNELQAIGTVDEARNYLIDLRIEEVLRGSFSDWITFFKEHLKLSMDGYLLKEEIYLIEICQRRNLFVHNGGMVNKIYLNKVTRDLHPEAQIGKEVGISQEYLDQAINRFEKFLSLLCFELWKSLRPTDEERGQALIDVAYKNLCSERWSIAESISFFLINDKRLSESSRLTGQINYWQSLKWQDNFDKARKEIEAADFSAKGMIFRLAKLVLLDDEKQCFELLPILLDTGALTEDDLRSWPLFRNIRQTETFQALYGEK